MAPDASSTPKAVSLCTPMDFANVDRSDIDRAARYIYLSAFPLCTCSRVCQAGGAPVQFRRCAAMDQRQRQNLKRLQASAPCPSGCLRPADCSFCRPGGSLWYCFKSCFKLHNESMNIWTHFAGLAFFLGITVYFFSGVQPCSIPLCTFQCAGLLSTTSMTHGVVVAGLFPSHASDALSSISKGARAAPPPPAPRITAQT